MNYLLSVGVNKYKYPGSDLRGCVNDVLNVRKTLAEEYGFSYVAMKTLFDQQATKENILIALTDMVRLGVSGDRLVFHFSGHGSQIPDDNGDEIDLFDEILCPHDFDWDGHYITDDNLNKIVQNLKKGVTLDVILDCCHSGTGLKDLNTQPKMIQSIYKYGRKEPLQIRRLLTQNVPSGVTLWSGCKSDQTSADAFINNAYNGALTYYFCEALKNKKGTSRAKIYRELCNLIRYYEQEPQLECSWYRRYRRIFK